MTEEKKQQKINGGGLYLTKLFINKIKINIIDDKVSISMD